MRTLLELKCFKATGYSGGAEELLRDLLRPQFAIATVCRESFENKPILFKQYENELGRLVAAAENAAETHNLLVKVECTLRGQNRTSRVDVASIKLDAQTSSGTVVQSLITAAKSKTRAALATTSEHSSLIP